MKRLLSALLVVMMLFSFLPVSALAEGTSGEESLSTQSEATVVEEPTEDEAPEEPPEPIEEPEPVEAPEQAPVAETPEPVETPEVTPEHTPTPKPTETPTGETPEPSNTPTSNEPPQLTERTVIVRSAKELQRAILDAQDAEQAILIELQDSVELTEDTTIPASATLLISGIVDEADTFVPAVLTVPDDIHLTNKGSILVKGQLLVAGEFDGNEPKCEGDGKVVLPTELSDPGNKSEETKMTERLINVTMADAFPEVVGMQEGVNYYDGEVLFEADTEKAARAIVEAYSAFNAELLRYGMGIGAMRLDFAAFSENKSKELAASKSLSGDTDGRIGEEAFDLSKTMAQLPKVEVNWVLYADGFESETSDPITIEPNTSTRNDTYYNQQWSLHGAYGIKAPQAWAEVDTQASPTTIYVAVIDSGIRNTHEDLSGILAYEYDAVNNQTGWGAAYPDDGCVDEGHGSHVAGIIAAQCNNGKGISGVAPNAKIIAVDSGHKGAYSAEEGGYKSAHSFDDIIRGIKKVIALKQSTYPNIKVINMSLGGLTTSLYSAFQTAINNAVNAGIMVVCSAGNNGINIPNSKYYHLPSGFDNTFTVAATTSSGQIANYSNYGAGYIDIAAPGSAIMSAVITSNSSYESWSGTSMAAPVVSGVAALMFGSNATLRNGSVANAMSYMQAKATPCTSSSYFGSGIVNAYNAVIAPDIIPTSISVSSSASSLMVGSTMQMTATVLPSNATNKSVTWSISSGASYASINSSGVLTANAAGTVTVKATSQANSSVYGTKTITVTPAASTAKYRAVIVGESDYLDNDLDVPELENDARAMKAALDTSDISYDSTLLISATKSTILNSISTKFGSATANDVSLFFFAGHGDSSTSAYGGTLATVEGNGIYPTELANALGAISGKVYVVIMACGSGALIHASSEAEKEKSAETFCDALIEAFRKQEEVSALSGELRSSKFSVLTSSAFGENSLGYSGAYSLFVESLLRAGGYDEQRSAVIAMQGDSNGDKKLTFAEGHAFTYNELSNYQHTQIYPANCQEVLFSRTGSTPPVVINPTSVSVSSSASTLTSGSTMQMTATVLPSNATNKSVTWSVSNTSAASISSSGVLTAKSVTANTSVVVTATSQAVPSKKGTKTITIKPVTVTSITVSSPAAYVYVGRTMQMSATAYPADASNRSVTWSVNNSTVASISSSGVLTAKAAGTVTVTATAQDGGGARGTKLITVYSTPSITAITHSPAASAVGSTVTWTVSATGGSGSYQYYYQLYRGSSVVNSPAWGSSNRFSETFSQEGSYAVRVTVKDGNGMQSVAVTSAAVPVAKKIVLESVTANRTASAVGTSVTWTANATGGAGVKQYYFTLKRGNTTVYESEWVTDKTYTYPMDKEEDVGNYLMRVIARDANGVQSELVPSDVLTVSPTLVLESVRANRGASAIGTPVTWVATSTGGAGVAQYYFTLKRGNTTVYESGWVTDRTYTYPMDKEEDVGNYLMRVIARDANGVLSETVNSPVLPVSKTIVLESVRANRGASAIGTPVTWVATSTGGAGVPQYYFTLKRGNTTVYESGWVTDRTYTYPMDKEEDVGNYLMRVIARDANGVLSETVNSPVLPVSKTIVLESVRANRGASAIDTPVTWVATSTGGAGVPQYYFTLKRGNTTVYESGWVTDRTYTYPMDKEEDVGNYLMRVIARDANGVLSETVNSPVLPVSKTIVLESVRANRGASAIDTPVTWVATSTGGAGVPQYYFTLKRGNTTVYESGWVTDRTYTYPMDKEEDIGTYVMRVIARDANYVNSLAVNSASLTVKPKIVLESVTANRTAGTIGIPVTWTANATGGAGVTQYYFTLKRGSMTVYESGWVTDKTYTYPMDKEEDIGSYVMRVIARDENYVNSLAVNSGLVSIYSKPDIARVTANRTVSAVGTPVTWTAISTGGAGVTQYYFTLKRGNTTVYESGWVTDRTYTYPMDKAEDVGNYVMRVIARDANYVNSLAVNSALLTVAPKIALESVTASRTAGTIGIPVTWTANATGGAGEKQYYFTLKKGNTNVAESGWISEKTYSYAFENEADAGSYYMRVIARDANYAMSLAVNSASIEVAEKPTLNAVTANKTSATVGMTVIWTANAAGGAGEKQYYYTLKKGTTNVVEKGWITGRSFSYTFTEPGSYYMRVIARDGNYVNSLAVNSASIEVAEEPTLNAVTANKTNATVGTTVVWTANATGGAGEKQYYYTLKKGTTNVVETGWITGRSYSHTFTEPGSYYMRVIARDGNYVNTLAVNSASIEVAEKPTLKVTANKTSATVGTTVVWTANATGGAGEKQYYYTLKKGTTNVVETGWITGRSYSYTFTEPGSYYMRVIARDGNYITSTAVNSASIEVAEKPTLKVTANKTSATVGTAIIWTANATGGAGEKQYYYTLKKGTTNVVETGWITGRSYSYTFTEPGSYYMRVIARDGNYVNSLAVNSASIEVAEKPALNAVTANKTSATVGTTVVWTANATGGAGEKQYYYTLKKGTTNVVETGWVTGRSYSHTFTEPGSYYMRVIARDGNYVNSLAVNSASIEVVEKPALNAVTANKTSATVGTTVVWTVSATGGAGEKQYYYTLKKGTTNVVETGWITGRSYSYTFTESGSYYMRVIARDGNYITSTAVNSVSTEVAEKPALNAVTANKTSATVGTAIIWTANATGGAGEKQYYYTLKKGTTNVVETGWITGRSYSYTFTEPGSYYMRVIARDGNYITSTAVNSVSIEVAEKPALNAVTANKTSATVGTAVIWTVSATGGAGEKQYYYTLKKGTTNVVETGWITDRSYSYTFTEPGSYYMRVIARDGNYVNSLAVNSASIIISQ